jgi:hypothetical protein
MNDRIRYISHRGNLYGVTSNRENDPEYVQEALDAGYDVEIDVWWKNGKFYLGHDEPTYLVESPIWLMDKRLWIHCKNIECLMEMALVVSVNSRYRPGDINYFWHQTDDVTLTSGGYLWTYPGKALTPLSIAVKPEITEYTLEALGEVAGICSDNIAGYKRDLKCES